MPAPELSDPSLKKQLSFFGGEWRTAASGDSFPVFNPASGSQIAAVPSLSAPEVNEAVEFAADAMRAWSEVPAPRRAALLRAWFEEINRHSADLALLLTLEQGKPLAEALGEIAYGASYIEWFSEEAKRLYGEMIPAPSNDRRILVIRQPVGVCAAITPWNFPNAMITRKVAPALAAGCSIVVKPASQTPLSALALAELASRAGLPPGVLSVVTGEASTVGTALLRHPLVRKVTFTGSTETGKKILAECAKSVKKVTMELGGNAPFLVFSDADLDAAVEGLMASKFRNSGQTCVCANRVFVEECVLEPFLAKLLPAVKNLCIGNGWENGTTQGPLIDDSALRKVESLVENAKSLGASVLLGGKRASNENQFFLPTVLTNCHHDMALAKEEIFGPVAAIFSFRSEEEAIRAANASPVGLAAYFYSRDIGKIWRVAEALEVGMVGVNTGTISNAMAPFGGIKESGFGREGSKCGIEDYTNLKYICMAGISS